ncbi:hypothetical protein LY78DRAFT_658335 [Colletotrichum sublineola]|nr:hypothetical protein LY78DRAFT_658335 [Colletotrichum sublineola]
MTYLMQESPSAHLLPLHSIESQVASGLALIEPLCAMTSMAWLNGAHGFGPTHQPELIC